ncbi:Hypothetical_protein [Hexamita inflata]|uniref:Hypothetical_protein n=1 Tax=Hexamita inflata TaxID=28002 RepID=A0ABP1IZV7_9EUKA
MKKQPKRTTTRQVSNELSKYNNDQLPTNDRMLITQEIPKARNHQTNTNLIKTNTNQKPIGQSHKSLQDQVANLTVTEMIDFNNVTQLHKQAQNGSLLSMKNQIQPERIKGGPSEIFKLQINIKIVKIVFIIQLQLFLPSSFILYIVTLRNPTFT